MLHGRSAGIQRVFSKAGHPGDRVEWAEGGGAELLFQGLNTLTPRTGSESLNGPYYRETAPGLKWGISLAPAQPFFRRRQPGRMRWKGKMRLFSSIHTKLMGILVFLGVLPLLALGYLSYHKASSALLFQTKAQLGNLSEKTAEQIDDFFKVSRHNIHLVSQYPFIQLAFLQHEFSQRLDTVERLLEDYIGKHPYLNRVYLIDPQGMPVLAVPALTPSDENLKIGSAPWFRNAHEEGQYLSDIIIGTGGKTRMILAQAVYDFEEKERKVGVLAFDIKTSAFTGHAASLKIGRQGHGFILHREGYLIHHPEPSLVLERNITDRGDERLGAHVARMRAGEKGFGEYRFDHEEKYLSYAPCREGNWSVGITMFKSELMADIYRLRHQMVTFFLIIMAMIVPASLLFIRSITRPIGALIRGAGAIGGGNLDQVITTHSSDEFRDLGEEFNRMAARLKSSMGQVISLKTFNEDILRSLSSGVITVDSKNRLTSINESARKILGIPSEPDVEEIGKVVWTGEGGEWEGRQGVWAEREEWPGFKPGAGHPLEKIHELFRATLSEGKVIRHREISLAGTAGRAAFVEVNAALLLDSSHRAVGAIADFRDITARKRIEERMVRIDKMASLGELSAGMAHEIRNPLAGIKTSVQVLRKRGRDEDEILLCDGVVHEIDRLNRIVTDLLRFSRPSEPVIRPVAVSDILDRSLSLVAEKIRKQRIVLGRRSEEGLPGIMVDREQIQQVFLNILLNALKATPPGGRLSISATVSVDTDDARNPHGAAGRSRAVLADKTGGLSPGETAPPTNSSSFVVLAFRDTGCGISEENLPRIFNPFFTTDPAGTGLGLPIVHEMMEKNGGRIFVESTAGEGTTVRVALPVEE